MEAALSAAEKTFKQSAHLPFDDNQPSAAGALQGRRRLAGAFAIEIARIRPDPTQPRSKFDPVAQAELTQSIKRLGILQPITVRYVEADATYQIIAGERRFRAAQEAALIEIPCWVQTPRDEDVLLQQIVENWQRADLHPFDLADSLARLRDTMKFSQKELAQETAKSEGEISKLLAILTLDPEVQKIAREDTTGSITKRHLYAIANISPQAQHAAIHAIVRHQLTVENTDRLVAAEKGKSHPAKRGAPVTRLTFRTSQATVMMTFRRKHLRPEEIVGVLDEVKRQVKADTKPAE